VVETSSAKIKLAELTTAVKIAVRWKLPKIDPKELYRLRFEENIPVKELAQRFERANDTIFSILGRYNRGRNIK